MYHYQKPGIGFLRIVLLAPQPIAQPLQTVGIVFKEAAIHPAAHKLAVIPLAPCLQTYDYMYPCLKTQAPSWGIVDVCI